MAKKNPSFLKRQKEHARKEKATEKRAARAERKKNPKEGSDGEGEFLRDPEGNLLLDEQGQPVRAPYADDYYDHDDDE